MLGYDFQHLFFYIKIHLYKPLNNERRPKHTFLKEVLYRCILIVPKIY